MRSQTTCSVSLFSSVHILTVGLRGVGLSEVDCITQELVTAISENQLSQNHKSKSDLKDFLSRGQKLL